MEIATWTRRTALITTFLILAALFIPTFTLADGGMYLPEDAGRIYTESEEADKAFVLPGEEAEFVFHVVGFDPITNYRLEAHSDNDLAIRLYDGDDEDSGTNATNSVPLMFNEANTKKVIMKIDIPDTTLEGDLTVNVNLVDTDAGGLVVATKTVVIEVMEEEMSIYFWIAPAMALMGLALAFIIGKWLMGRDKGSEKVADLSKKIFEGAMSFLNAEYRYIIIFVVVVGVLLGVLGFVTDSMNPMMAVTFVIGAIFSALTGNIGMRIATASNGRTAVACKRDMKEGLAVAFSSGAVMGLCVVSIGLLGVSVIYLLFQDLELLFGFGFGASSIALFARVGGGIYTKAADVGADLVGKVEAGIPEDDPRNPAVIADNVGDNVGDVAGMGADLFESYVDSIIAAMILGMVGISVGDLGVRDGGIIGMAVLLPMILAGIGILSAIIGIVIVRASDVGKNPHAVLNRGILASAFFMAIASLLFIILIMGDEYWKLYVALIVGLASGLVIGFTTEYFTSDHYTPTRNVAKASVTGAATNIIQGLSLGMYSTAIPVIFVCIAILVSFQFAGLYGIALAAVGMLSTLGMTLATDTYGPVADNAAGIAEMANLGKTTRRRAEELDAVGNTTAAIGKGFAIGSAGLTALALFASYMEVVNLDLSTFSLVHPDVMVGIFIGALLPFLFAAMTMNAVGKAAMDMVEEVRSQFRKKKGIMEGTEEPDYERCISISTKAALREMIAPTLIAVVTPVAIGLWSPAALGGLLAGGIVSGFLLAVMMANSGGAWDNAKKYIESGALGGKGSEPHKAAVVGDTVGDPFKDTSGPSLNILIKLMSIVAVVFAPLFIL